jgi:hypothetical protein
MRRLVAVLAATLATATLGAVPASARNVQPPFHDYVISRHDILDGEATYGVYRSHEHANLETTEIAYGYHDHYTHKWHWVGWLQLGVNWYLTGPNNVTTKEQGWIENSRTVIGYGTVFAGALRKGTAGSYYGGDVIHNCKPFIRGRSVPAWEVSSTRHPFCVESDTKSVHHNMSLSFNFLLSARGAVGDYYWRCSAFSPVAYRLSGKYWFGHAYNLVAHPFTCTAHFNQVQVIGGLSR